ncbi:MAG: terminase [Acidaminococcales bacterium]|jgi:hypothetical protein|nr:terminase [Acidaminococcales bacterium]
MQNEDLRALIRDLGAMAHDPLKFVHYAFPWGEGPLAGFDGPDGWQRDVLRSVRDKLLTPFEAVREAVASGHGIGKSALVSWLILWALSTHEETKGVVTANTETQLKTKTWSELAKWHRLFIGRRLFAFTATALFSSQPGYDKTWRVDMVAWSERNTEAFAGLHNKGKRILVVFDEASAIPDVIWDVTEGALTDEGTQIFFFAFGNPTRGQGRFFDCFHRLRHRWTTRQIDSRKVGMTNKKQLKQWVEDYGEDSDFVKVRVRGVFPSAGENQFISTEIVDRAQKVSLREGQIKFAPVVIGVDPSWTGADEFVIFLRQGLFCELLARFAKNDDDSRMAGIIARFEDERKAAAVNVDAGFGTGVYSAGKGMGRRWTLVNFAGKPFDDCYANRRAEMWGEMKRWLLDGGALPADDQVLRDELVGPEAFINHSGKLQLESKDDMKKRGLASPNRADALALTFAAPVRPGGARARGADYSALKGM